MRKFDHLKAIEYLLELDTNILNPERYYPWFMHTKGILINSGLWILTLLLMAFAWITLFKGSMFILLGILFSTTILFGILYGLIFRFNLKEAQHKAIQQMMRLEKKEFMKAIEPFVPEDQRDTVARIIKFKSFTAKEYASVTLATKSRIIFNTDAFIKDIERMMEDIPQILADIDDTYCDTVFKVPQNAIEHYREQQLQQEQGTFNDLFTVPLEVRQAIIMKIKQAAHLKKA